MKDFLKQIVVGTLVGVLLGWGFGIGYRLALGDFLSNTKFTINLELKR